MMTLVDFVRKSDKHSISAPVLVIYSPNDKVISAEAVEKAFEQIGSNTKALYPILESENPECHVLAGDILAPGDTHAMVDVAVTFLSKLK
jgi:esterase/lipase